MANGEHLKVPVELKDEEVDHLRAAMAVHDFERGGYDDSGRQKDVSWFIRNVLIREQLEQFDGGDDNE